MDHQYASMILPRTIDLPSGGEDRDVLIQVFPEEAKWDDDISTPVMEKKLVGKVYGDRPEIYLPERVVFDVDRLVPRDSDDAMVRIIVDGSKVYFHKIKYEEAGVERDDYFVHYLDVIRPYLVDSD